MIWRNRATTSKIKNKKFGGKSIDEAVGGADEAMNFHRQKLWSLDRGLDTDTKTELQDRHHESMAKTSTWIKRIVPYRVLAVAKIIEKRS